MKKLPVILLCSVTLFFSCSKTGKRPDYVLHPDSLASVLYDIHLAEAIAPTLQIYGDSVSRFMTGQYEAIYVKHHITRQQFDTSFAWYLQNPSKMRGVYQEVLDKLNEK